MGLEDKELEKKKILKLMLNLEIKMSEIAETPLRHQLSEDIVDMRMRLINFKEER